MSHTNHDRSCYSKNSKFASIILLKSNILSIRHAQKCLVITSFRRKILGCLQLSSLLLD